MTDLLIPVILSGGAGTRLWPASRHMLPKPFLTLPDGQTLAAKTLARAARVGGPCAVTVTGADHEALTRAAVAGTGGHGLAMHYVLEPVGRNTAPAIAAAAHLVADRWGPDATLLVMPADHLIEDLDAFAAAVGRAAELARGGFLVTFGIEATRPETGYGYIQRGQALAEAGFRVARFVEKPEPTLARLFVGSGEYHWNAGIFCFTARTFLAELARHAPGIATPVRACWRATGSDGSDGDAVRLEAEHFARVPAESIDYAVMERSDRAAVVPCAIGWSDVGSWATIQELIAADDDGNRLGTVGRAIEARRCFVQSEGERIVALVGVEDLVVVDTDDAVLITRSDRTQAVKEAVAALRAEGHPAATDHPRSVADWGEARILEQSATALVRRLRLRPEGTYRAPTGALLVLLEGDACDEAGVALEAGEGRAIDAGCAVVSTGGAVLIELSRRACA